MQNRILLFGALALVLASCGRSSTADDVKPDKFCKEGTDPIAPPPLAFDETCPPLAEATLESCTKEDLLFSESQRMCVKECPDPPFQLEGKVCKGSSGGGNPGCKDPTPYRRCTWGNVCYCSSTR